MVLRDGLRKPFRTPPFVGHWLALPRRELPGWHPTPLPLRRGWQDEFLGRDSSQRQFPGSSTSIMTSTSRPMKNRGILGTKRGIDIVGSAGALVVLSPV